MAVRFSLSRPTGACALNFLRVSPGASARRVSNLTAINFQFNFKDSSRHGISSLRHLKPVAAIQPQVRGLTTKKEIEDNLHKYKDGQFDTIPDPTHLEHFKERVQEKEKTGEATLVSSPQGSQDKMILTDLPIGAQTLPHPIWSEKQLHDVTSPTSHLKLAYGAVKLLRGGFDVFSGFKIGQRNEHKWLKRIIFLETVAGVPGMVAAMLRHMTSLRRMQRDHGWIHTLLEEAENERMHLMTALQLKQPSWMFRTAVIGSQGVFVTLFSVCYIISPRFCHRFVGYLEEEAVKTYTKCLEDINEGPMKHWQTQVAPDLAIRYWKLPEDAKMRDVILAIRADEAHHRVVNHTLASMKPDQFNPYKPGQ